MAMSVSVKFGTDLAPPWGVLWGTAICHYGTGKPQKSLAFRVDMLLYERAASRTENPRVGGSIPPLGTNDFKYLDYLRWPLVPDVDNEVDKF